MKFYRLSENDERYGIAGNVIPHDVYVKLPYVDKPLYDAIDEHGRGFPYKAEVSVSGQTPVLFYLYSYADLIVLIGRLGDRMGIWPERLPNILPMTDITVHFGGYSVTIKYRHEWTQDKNISSPKDT